MFQSNAMAQVRISKGNRIVIPREARKALGVKPGDDLSVIIQGKKVLVFQKLKSHSAAIRGLARRGYPNDYLERERGSWD